MFIPHIKVWSIQFDKDFRLFLWLQQKMKLLAIFAIASVSAGAVRHRQNHHSKQQHVGFNNFESEFVAVADNDPTDEFDEMMQLYDDYYAYLSFLDQMEPNALENLYDSFVDTLNEEAGVTVDELAMMDDDTFDSLLGDLYYWTKLDLRLRFSASLAYLPTAPLWIPYVKKSSTWPAN